MADERLVGPIYIDGVVAGRSGRRTVKSLIDSGASYSVLPHGVWREIGLGRTLCETLYLANNSTIERDAPSR